MVDSNENLDNEQVESSSGSLNKEILSALDQTEQEISVALTKNSIDDKTWHNARQVVEKFKPVPWFIWRLSNYVLGQAGKCNRVNDGLVFGLKNLLIKAAADPILGGAARVNTTQAALRAVSSDAVAAVAVIHSINRRLQNLPLKRFWTPLLDDALLRAQIGYLIGERRRSFGAGRGMLAGYAGRIGLIVLLAFGNEEQASESLTLLSSGSTLSEVGARIYDCDPLQVSAMVLSASGCGREAAYGTVSYSLRKKADLQLSDVQKSWLAGFTINEAVRSSDPDLVEEQDWLALGFSEQADREDLMHVGAEMVRKGHGWAWLLGS